MAGSTQLERLLIEEISGVDDGANLAQGWAVMKGRRDLESAVEDSEAELTRYLNLRTALDAVASQVSSAPSDVVKAVSAVREWVGGELGTSDGDVGGSARKMVSKIKAILKGKGEQEMTKDELSAELDARLGTLSSDLAGVLKGAIADALTAAAPVAPAAPAAPVAPAAPAAPDAGAVTSAGDEPPQLDEVLKALEATQEALMKALDRIELLEKGTASRTSLDGEESQVLVKMTAPTVRDAIGLACAGKAVELR